MTGTDEPRPGDDALPAGIWKIAAIASLGSFLAQIDATMINVALPGLVGDLQSSIGTIQWVVTGYLLALTLVLPLSGYLVGHVGAKAVYLGCFAGFAVTSALCGLAWSSASLIGFRILQGIGGGLLAPLAQMMIARAAGSQMARVAGYAAIPVLLGPILGPVAAGFVLQYLSWRWLFLLTALVAAAGLLLAQIFLSADRPQDIVRRPLDWTGLALLSPGLALLLLCLDHLSSPAGLAALAVALVLLALFVASARARGGAALVDLGLFAHRPFRTAALAQFLTNGGTFAAQMSIPMLLVVGYGRLSGEIGWLMAPLGVGMMCAYPTMGSLVRRLGARRVASAGALLSLLAAAMLAAMAGDGALFFLLPAALFLFGAGQGAIGIASMSNAYTTISPEDLPMATTSLNICQRLGGPVMTTVAALFLDWRLAVDGAGLFRFGAFQTTFLLLCALLALVCLAALRLPRAGD